MFERLKNKDVLIAIVALWIVLGWWVDGLQYMGF